MFLETLSVFFQPVFPEKGESLPKLDRSCDVSGRVNTVQSLFFLEVQAEETDSGFPKTF